MGSYQYYEFLSIDKSLSHSQMNELRSISSRARISATSFVNVYNFGSFKGNPEHLVEDYFDLHLFFADWGARNIALKFPKILIDPETIQPFLSDVTVAPYDPVFIDLKSVGDSLILDVRLNEEEPEYGWYEEDDFNRVTAALSSLRSDVLAGDYSLFHLIWLLGVQGGIIGNNTPEPLGGLPQITNPFVQVASFLQLDQDLVLAANQGSDAGNARPQDKIPSSQVRDYIDNMPDTEKNNVLFQLYQNNDPYLAAAFSQNINKILLKTSGATGGARRTAGEIVSLVEAVRKERLVREGKQRAEAFRRQKEEKNARQQKRLLVLAQRGAQVWQEVEDDIMLRHASAYDRASALLEDLKALTTQQGKQDFFSSQVLKIREDHAQKKAFLKRLDEKGL